MDRLDYKSLARTVLDRSRDDLLRASREIHAHPELAYEETRACDLLCGLLERAGMQVERGVAELPTAFVAKAGEGRFHIAFCAEYDALPDIGHACGHNIIATSSLGAGLALAEVADDLDLTVSVIGTPAEEIGDGGGKILLLERGVFDTVHTSMMVHPGPLDVAMPPMLACASFDAHYRGVEAHASAFPQRGVNAADAMTIAQTAIALLRQQMRGGDRVHGIVTHGGEAANVIPGHTSARYIVRSKTFSHLEEIKARVVRCFEAGAVGSGAKLEIRGGTRPYAHMQHAAELAALYQANAESLGRAFPDLGRALERGAASTDMGNVSVRMPSIHPIISIDANRSVPHQPEFARYCVGSSADRAMADGALALAWTAIDIAADDRLRADYERQLTVRFDT